VRKREHGVMPVFGGSSLLVIFSVLCLTVFALLSLSTVLAHSRLSDAAAEAVSAYYAADAEAEVLFARLREGELPEGVEKNGEYCSYSCPISETQRLEVELRQEGGTWTVLRWQAVSTAESAGEADLPVWDGETTQ